MAHYDLYEQEQIAGFKYFWGKFGKYIMGVVLIAILIYVGNSIYNWHLQKNSKAAALIYSDFIQATSESDNKIAFAKTNQLQKAYPKTEYAAMASIQSAKIAFDKRDLSKAEEFLYWTHANAQDKGLVSLSALRLASIFIDEKKFDKARSLLLEKHNSAYDGLFYEARGDMYIAKDDINKARDAYKEALSKSANDQAMQQTIQMKLDILGG